MHRELQEAAEKRPPNEPDSSALYVYAIGRRRDLELLLAAERLPEAIEPPAPRLADQLRRIMEQLQAGQGGQ